MTTTEFHDETAPSQGGGLVPMLIALALALAAAAFTYLCVTPEYVIDDAFIGFRYARHLYEGHNIVFNHGENVEGYTSFLWVVMSAGSFFVGLDPIEWVQGISLVAQFATVLLTFATARRMGMDGLWALLPTALVATNISVLTYPMTGMDTSFIAVLVIWSVYLIAGGFQKWYSGVALGLVLCLIVLTRFDGFVMAGMLLSFLLLFQFRKIGHTLVAGLIVVACLAAYHYWRLEIMGYEIWPNTAKAKMTFGDQAAKGVGYFLRYLREGNQFVVLGLALPFLLGRGGGAVGVLGWVGGWHLAYAIVVGGDWMPFWRFMLPVTPLLLLATSVGVKACREAAASSTVVGKAVVGLTVVGLLVFNLGNLQNGAFRSYRVGDWLEADKQPFTWSVYGELFDGDEAKTIGQHINENFPEDWYLAMEWAGVIPFWAHQRVFDILALNDADATNYRDENGNGFESSQIGMFTELEWVVENKNPDLVVVVARLYDTVEDALAGANHKMHGGDPNSSGGRWQSRFYGRLTEEPFPYRIVTTKIGDKYWPFALRKDHEVPGAAESGQ